MTSNPIRIFCGADRSQQLPFEVLAHSIRRHTARAVEVRLIDNALAPMPGDARHAPYTEFSFARFAIPALCGHAGRAVYMDSDMLVSADIAELWDTPLQGAKIAIEAGSRDQQARGRHAAVMLLDCAALDWDVGRIVADLGDRYDYNPLMAIDPLLEPGDMRELIPSGWNDLDQLRPGITRNVHYTEIRTQPWVWAGHPVGGAWIDEVKLMLANGALAPDAVREEVRLGYARPSLPIELGIDPAPAGVVADDAASLRAFDAKQGFVAHRRLLARFAERKKAIARQRRDHAGARQPWLRWWHALVYRWRYGSD